MNGEEGGDSENVANEEEETVINSCYYDKTKSFFDNLSSENTRYMCILTFFADSVTFFSALLQN